MSTATLVDIAGSRLTATVSSLGAELQTLQDADGRHLLWNGDPAVWAGRAPLLFPIVGRLAGDTYRLDGATYALPQHGFARRREFTIVDRRRDAVTLRLDADDWTRASWPFGFRLAVTHRIGHDDARLETTATLVNTGPSPLPASFGFHPGLRWPLPYGKPRDEHEINFERDEIAPIHRPTADGLIDPAAHPTPVRGRRLALDDALFEAGAVVFTELASRRCAYGATGGPKIALEFPDTPHLGIWTKPGARAGYVCIEPWQGYADPVGFTGDIRDKPGVVILAPGETRLWRLAIAVLA
jgi:galactose mutarotase-like enzyme